MFRFPYSNLYELNLDWILSEVKKIAELIPSIEGVPDQVAYAVNTANQAIQLAQDASQAIVSDGSITTSKLADGAVTTNKIADNSITSDKLDIGVIDTPQINNSAVTAIKIATDAVTTGKIQDGAVTYDKLAQALQDKLNYKILYFPSIACTVGVGDFAVATNVHINDKHVLASIVFADPTAVDAEDTTWTSAIGTFKLNGTCNANTTCAILLVEKGN